MTKLPRLYVDGKFNKILHPISLTVTENITPLSTASITLPEGESIPVRSWVEVFTPYGSAGMYRVRSPHNGYGDGYSTAELEHMIAEFGDYCVKDEYSEMVSAKTAVSRVFSHYKGGKWKLGSYSDIGDGNVALDAKYDSCLTVLLSILDQRPDCMLKFDFSKTPWVVSIVKKGTSVVAQGRLSRNVRSATVTYDDSELVTRLWYQTYYEVDDGDGNKKLESKWNSRDENVKKYGVVEGRVSTSSDMTGSEIDYVVSEYLKKHKDPRVNVSMQAVDLAAITSERMDKFVIGDLYRLAIPDYSLNVELNITSIVWNDVYNNPKQVTIHLGEEEDTVVTFLHNLDATGSGTTGGSGGGGAGKKKSDEWSEYRSDWQVLDNIIYGYVQRVDRSEKILQQAGLDITADGVLIYAQDNENNIQSKINVEAKKIELEVEQRKKEDGILSGKIKTEAGKISLIVEEKDGKNVIKAASIITSINKDGSSVVISADHIDLRGYVKATDITADYIQGKISKLAVLSASSISTGSINVEGTVDCSTVEAGNVKTDSLNGFDTDDMIVGASVSGNTLTLTKGGGGTVTFSKATSLTGAWGGGVFTATASPQGNSLVTSLTVGAFSWSGLTATATIYATIGNSGTLYDTGETASVNASSVFNHLGQRELGYLDHGNFESVGRHDWYYRN